jgi:predicted  nucleic acid-binding Zn-ribbon protein
MEEKKRQVRQLEATLADLNTRHDVLQQQLDAHSQRESKLVGLHDGKVRLEREKDLVRKELEHIRKDMSSRIEEGEEALDALEASAMVWKNIESSDKSTFFNAITPRFTLSLSFFSLFCSQNIVQVLMII